MALNLDKFEDIQEKIASQVDSSKAVDFNSIKTVAGFDCAFFNTKIVCAAVVFDLKTKEVIEKKYTISDSQMSHIPGFTAFREGPAIIQTYYSLENNPDILMLDGHGIAHQKKCGLATYVGLELEKPSIGIAKNLAAGEVKDNKIIIDSQHRGAVVKTKTHANQLFVSPGHLIDITSCVEITQKLVFAPHKMPEPLHEAHKFAKKTAVKLNGGQELDSKEIIEESEQERIEKEFKVNSGSIV